MEATEHQLWALSPLDGRYRPKVAALSAYFSEAALCAYRLRVEAHWLLALGSLPELSKRLPIDARLRQALTALTTFNDPKGIRRIKEIEQMTNHDVKAVEYYLREFLSAQGAPAQVLSWIHFACTSEDINNIAYSLMLRDARREVLLPAMDQVVQQLQGQAQSYKAVSMLARTHGQPASPTTLGKELAVFVYRLLRQRQQFANQALLAKMNGAVGNFNAHVVALPDVNWPAFAEDFVSKRLGLTYNPLTTQIESHDSLVEYGQSLARFNTIATGLCRDIWAYVSVGYFAQKSRPSEVGSSTMPHKINPIDFENAEGNLGVANALFQHFAEKLPISRWQRDLSDSTVQRAIGCALGHSLLAYESLRQGLSRIAADESRISEDLEGHWEVLAEAVQTVMRSHGIVDAYERLKALTRGSRIDREQLRAFISACTELPGEARERLLKLQPRDYVGLAVELSSRARPGTEVSKT